MKPFFKILLASLLTLFAFESFASYGEIGGRLGYSLETFRKNQDREMTYSELCRATVKEQVLEWGERNCGDGEYGQIASECTMRLTEVPLNSCWLDTTELSCDASSARHTKVYTCRLASN